MKILEKFEIALSNIVVLGRIMLQSNSRGIRYAI